MTAWPIKTLGEVAQVCAGNSAPQDKVLFKNGTHRFVRTSDVGQVRIGRLGQSADLLNDEGARGLREFRAGVTLIPKSGASTFLNHRVQLTKPCFVSSHLAVVDANKKIMDDTFVFYFLQTVRSQDLIQDQSYPSLNLPAISGIEVLVPPLEEQKRIVELLNAATAHVTELTECYEQARTHANNLFASALRDSLASNPDWPIKTLGEVCSIESVLVDPRESKYSSLSHIGAGNIESRTGRLFDIKTASEENLISGKYLFSEKDVLYSKIRPYLVKVAAPETSGLCSADVYPLRPGSTLNRMFLFYLLISETFTEYAVGGSSRTGMPKVNREHLFKYETGIPPTAVQLEIITRLRALREKTSEMVAAYDVKLTAAKNLRQSILEAAFAGDL
jgi:type I restriction enzyme S subunit